MGKKRFGTNSRLFKKIKIEKSTQVEDIATRIATALQDLTIFPKMYHPNEDQIDFGLIVDGKKVIIEIKTAKTK